MGSGTLTTRANLQTIDETWFNQFRNAFNQDLVPRNSSGVATDQGGSLGTSSLRFLNAYLLNMYLMDTSHYIKHIAPSGLANDYIVQWPGALPGSTVPLQITTGGILTFAQLPAGGIASDAVITAKILDANVTAAKLESNINLIGTTVRANSKNLVVSNTNPSTNLAIIRGSITSAGVVSTGEGFSSSRSSVGVYDLTFSIAFADSPSVTCTTVNPAFPVIWGINNLTTGGCRLLNTEPVSSTRKDEAVSFIIIGLRA